MLPTESASFEFGPFRVDRGTRQLLRDGRPVPLTPKAFDTLVLLLASDGRLVSKEDLMSVLWPGTFVTEANLTQTVFLLRKALGETAGEPRYIVTVSGRGYRFVESVRRSTAPEVSAPAVVRSASRTQWAMGAAIG